MKKAIIIRYCEIHLKGKNRSYFEKLLKENIKRSIKDIPCEFTAMHSRYLIVNFSETDLFVLEERLKKIAGIHSYSIAYVVDSTVEKIFEAAKELLKDKIGTFKVITNRADKTFTPDSMQLSMLLGGKLLEVYGQNLKVDVKNPQIPVYVDIREDGKTFIYGQTIHCMSGMPVGSSGRGLLLISGGIDSPVAGYMMCKRGMKLDMLHFHSFPYTGEAAKEKVKTLAEKIAQYNGGANLYIISVTHIQEEIHKKCPEEFMITLLRRFMMRLAQRLANDKGDQTIVTGESLGQVASQTIESITASNSVVTLPVMRPLIAFDKIDIVEIARRIDTYETSILPFEDCCTVFLPKFPAIKPNLEKVIKAESALDVQGLLDEAYASIEKVVI